ncbi:MAG TPA: hypothetical protein DCX07_15065 [Phycisphaerales bacterium]|nr:hypothetical protein [Phycisphaerales bacterium]
MKRLVAILTVAAVLWGLAGAATAQEAQKVPKLGEGKGMVTLSWDEFVRITGYDPTKKSNVITVPWKEVQDLLNVEVKGIQPGTSIDLPWNEFKELLKWSVERRAADKTAPPPTDYIVASADYTGALGDESAEFTLKLKLNILREKGWKRIVILPNEVALTKYAFQPADGVYLSAASGQYELLTEKTGVIEATLTFTVKVNKAGGINTVSFSRPLAGSSLLEMTLDRENVDVKVASAQSQLAKTAAGKTTVAAAIPAGPNVAVSWERALPKVEKADPKLYAETRTLVAVGDGMLLCQEMVNYNILHAGVRELKLTAPKGASVLTVSGQSVSDWRISDAGELTVVLRGEAIGAYSLYITYEQPAKDSAAAPVLRTVGVERERGYVGVIALANVEIAAGEATGATAIDVRQLPSDIVAMTNQPILLAYRYVGEKFTVPLTIRRHEEVSVLATIVDSALLTAMQLNDGRRITNLVYSVRNNRNQFLRVKMPADAEIWSVAVAGNAASPAKDKDGNVLIPLIRSSTGSREMTAFPVEIVYVQTPEKTAPPQGRLKVTLPSLTVPVMHVMFNYYLPAEGKYTVPEGLFGEKSGFTGPMRLVTEFASLSTGPGAAVIRANAAQQAQGMQKQFDERVAREAMAAGATPMKVELPINGKLFRLEKILALPGDELFFEVAYSGWKAAE